MLYLTRKPGERIMLNGQRYVLTLRTITDGIDTPAVVVDFEDTTKGPEQTKSVTLMQDAGLARMSLDIRVGLKRVHRREAVLGIEAPAHVDIQREELLTQGRAA